MAATPDLTQTLLRSRRGEREALDEMLVALYAELRGLAAGYLRHERVGHTLQPTALAHEAFLRLVDQRAVSWQDRAHFLALAAQAMRRILADQARRRHALKRGGDAVRVALEDVELVAPGGDVEIDALDSALEKLAALDARQAQIVELRFFGGLTLEETAEVVEVSTATVKRDWLMARAWLHRELGEQAP